MVKPRRPLLWAVGNSVEQLVCYRNGYFAKILIFSANFFTITVSNKKPILGDFVPCGCHPPVSFDASH
jgi:hypothetical protein